MEGIEPFEADDELYLCEPLLLRRGLRWAINS
jgi:hypothetical protein